LFWQIILALGNYMNSSKRGAVYGFKLQSLDLVSKPQAMRGHELKCISCKCRVAAGCLGLISASLPVKAEAEECAGQERRFPALCMKLPLPAFWWPLRRRPQMLRPL